MENDVSLINSFVTKTEESVCYLNISEHVMRSLLCYDDKDYMVIDLKHEHSPLKPFLILLKLCKPSEKDIQECVYSLHQDIFRDFLRDGKCSDRHDGIIEQEYFYEQQRIASAIVTLLERLNTNKYIFLNCQYMLKESLDIVSELEKSKVKGKFVFCFDSINSNLFSEYSQNFIEKISHQRNFLNIPISETEMQDNVIQKTMLDRFQKLVAFQDLSDYNSIFYSLRNFRLFISFEESKLMNLWVVENLQNLSISNSQKRNLYLEIAKIYYDNDNLDEAALYLNNIMDYQSGEESEMEALYYLAKIFAKKKANQDAKKYILQLKQSLKPDKTNWLYAQTINLEYLVTLRTEKNAIKLYTNAINCLKTANLINNYIATSLNIPWTLISDKNYKDTLEKQLEESMTYARALDNQHLISSICHRRAIILSHYGKVIEAMQYNMECNRIRTEIGELQPLLAIRNGLSYEALNQANYAEAYNYVNDIIGKIYTINDYCTIIDTLKNITYAVFYSRHFDQAEEMFSLMIYFLNTFDLKNSANNSFLPSLNDLLIYKSLICIENNDFIHAQMNYLNITSNNELISEVDRPLLHYIKAAILAEDKDLERAFNEFENGIIEFEINCRTQVHKKVFIYYEFANVLYKLGFTKESKKYLQEGFQLAEANGLSFYTKRKSSITLKDYVNHCEHLNPLNISLNFLHEKAEKDRLMNQLHHKLYDYQFLNKIKNFNASATNIKKYLEITNSLMLDYSNAKEIIVAEKTENNWKKLLDISREESIKIPSSLWDYYFDKYNIDSQLVWDSKNSLYYANLSKFEYTFAILIVPKESTLLTSDSLSIMNIAITNILAQLVMFKQNENLVTLSTTDQLSMLKNRRALQEFINVESEKLQRLKSKRKITLVKTIAFIDLDNFKYYNDTYGHWAGDLLIQCFSNMLKKVLRRSDFICRFGGDEFVVVMSDTEKEEALISIERLRRKLEEEEHFIPQLMKRLNVIDLNVPEEKLLNFSVGLCTNTLLDNPSDLNECMRNADVALYYSKEHGKRITTSFDKIKN